MKLVEWNPDAAEQVLALARYRSFEVIEQVYGDAMPVVAGCLRGLFIADPGNDLICSDYSSIEAVVLAELAGCEWRREVFRTHGKIYEVSGAHVMGVDESVVLNHKALHGQHHPARKPGKVYELACGFGGWIGSARAFDAPGTDEEIKRGIIAWRDASPEVPDMWGGQPDWRRAEYYGIEGAFVQAVLNPGQWFFPYVREASAAVRGIGHLMWGDCLYVQLLSGRVMHYHRPRLAPSTRQYREGTYAISYEGYNTNPKNGAMGWVRIDTYGPRLTENYVQATANDLLRAATVGAEAEGYPIVLHVYDELVAEVPEGFGSIEGLEAIMMRRPAWAATWPIKATGGWRAKRYRK